MLRKLTIDKIGKQLSNKRILMRVDFNVPLKNNQISDETRIIESLPTIQYAQEQGAKSIILLSHMGRPNGERNKKYSLEPVSNSLSKHLGKPVEFLEDCIGDSVQNSVNKGSNSQIFLCENLRFHAEEEGSRTIDKKKVKSDKENIQKFRNSLTNLGDIYINDAFGTCHRAHSSIAGINLQTRAAGFLVKKELEAFSKILENPKRPLTVILGGAKVKDKIQLIQNLLDRIDKLIITGGMAFTFLKHIYKMEIGKSIYDEEGGKIVGDIVKMAKEKNVELIFPEDFVVSNEINENADTSIVNLSNGIPSDLIGIDVGPNSEKIFNDVIKSSETIFLNGACGIFELSNARNGSVGLVNSLTDAAKRGCTTVCGGGDTISMINSVEGAREHIYHLSTGGGASLELLEGKILPGIDYLSDVSEYV